MRTFEDAEGRTWVAHVHGRGGADYKGRYHLVLTPADDSGEPLPLRDLRWNSERTAKRTLDTMSEVELRRRLRIARGRGSPLSGCT